MLLYCSVTRSCLTLFDPMDCSTAGLPVLHCLPEFAQTRVHWVNDAIQPSSSFVSPFSFYPQSFPASRSFPMSQLFPSGGQRFGSSASFLPKNTQDWSPLEGTGWISLQSKGLSRVFSKYPGVGGWGGEEINCFPPPSTKNSKRVRAASLAEHHEEGEVKPEGHAPSSQMSSLDFFPVISF